MKIETQTWKVAWLLLMAALHTDRQLRNAIRGVLDSADTLRELPRAWLLRVVACIDSDEPMIPNGRDHH
jgi:hypothetical protein